MANINNHLFEWCYDVTEVRTNYSRHNCVQMIKNQIVKYSGADEGFVKSITNRSENEFSFDCRFVPVYQTHVDARYFWTETSTSYSSSTYVEVETTQSTDYSQDKHFSKFHYKGIDKSLELDRFIGGQDQRFYSLNLPSDLDYPLYNTNNNCFTEKEISEIIPSVADAPTSKQTRNILGWNCEVYFVPVACVTYAYNGKNYTATINQHNGKMQCEYMLSEKASRMAAEVGELNKKNSLISMGVTAAVFIYSLIHLFAIPGDIGWDILFSVCGIIAIILPWTLFPGDEKLRQIYGADISKAAEGISDSKATLVGILIYSGIIFILQTIL